MQKKDELKQKRGERVKELRKKRNLTQEEFSEMVGIKNSNHLSMIERGERGLTFERAKVIAATFPPVRFEWLMCFDDFETPLAEKAFPVFKKLYEKNLRIRAVESLFKTVKLSFELNTAGTKLEGYAEMNPHDFLELSDISFGRALEETDLILQRPDAYLIKKDGEILGYCSDKEKDALFNEIFSFVEFKIMQICEREDADNG